MRGAAVLGVSVAGLLFSFIAAASIATAYAGQTMRVSVSSAGVAANLSATSGVLSADGRYVVFQSNASNLVPGVSGTHVYRHDRINRTTALVDIAKATGLAGTGPGLQPTVSGDGRFVAFTSPATDLVDGDLNGWQDVFVRDMNSRSITLASTTSSGEQANGLSGLSGLSGAHEISDDGRYVVFTSMATNLAGTLPGVQHVYRKDMTASPQVVELISVNSAEEAANLSSFTPAISGNGLFVAFNSPATNLSSSTTGQVYVRDIDAGTTSLESAGAAAAGLPATVPVLSDDGRFVAFVTAAHLDPQDADNGNTDVFLRDRALGTTVTASPSLNTASGVPTGSPSISGNGRWVGYQSIDDKIVTGDVGGLIDVFLYDRDTGAVVIVSRNDAGDQANMLSVGASVSRDGQLVLFGSTATNLFSERAPVGVNQLYVRNLASNQAPVLPPFGRDVVLSEGQPLRLSWSFSDNDGSIDWDATVNYGDGSGRQELDLNEDKTFVLSHSFAPGEYDVTVVVRDDAGAPGTLVIHVVVNNIAPTVNMPPAVNLAFTRTLTGAGSFIDPGLGSAETYSATVNWGDGTPTQALALDGDAFTLLHTYANAGSHTVTVTVTDSNRDSGTGTMAVNIGGYSYEWLDPVGTTFTVGRNLPVKFRVVGPNGAAVFDQTVGVDVVDASGTVRAGPYVFGDQPSRSVTWSGDSYHVNVDTKDLAPGMYWLRVRFSSATLSGEFTLVTNGTAGSSTSSRSRLH